MTRGNHKINRPVGFLAGLIVKLFVKGQKKSPIKKNDFRTSTQRMGIGFTEEIRNFERKKWIFKKRD